LKEKGSRITITKNLRNKQKEGKKAEKGKEN
jgi:hypothetical protein